MIFRRWGQQAQNVYQDYPSTFWTLVGATFIDRLGGALLFPFFALYITQRFSVGMTDVGVLFAIFSIAGIVGGVVSGALTDRFGRKGMLLAGLILSALSSLTMGFIERLELFYLLAGFVGLFANAGGPAQQAMVADLLPDEKRTGGYGMVRVAVNLAVTIGPAIGGLLATRSYLALFIADAVTSLITAAIVALTLPETKPQAKPGEVEPNLAQTVRGYGLVARDLAFMVFILASIIMTAVYIQMNTSLSVYLRDVHGVPERGYGLLLSLNAAMVVAFQFWISRKLSSAAPLILMAVGTLLYGVGFGMYGVVSTYTSFALAMVIITIGEMIVVPTSQALVARFSPETMRGRYMAIFGFSWAIPATFAPLLAGVVMDNYNPDWVWYGCALATAVSALGYLTLHRSSKARLQPATPAAESSF